MIAYVKTLLQKQPELRIAIFFVFALTLFEIILFGTNYMPEYESFFTLGNILLANGGLLTAALTTHLIFVIYIWHSLQSSPRWRVAYFVLFALGIALEYGSVTALGRFITHYEVSLSTSATSENWQSAIGGYFNPWVFVPYIVYGGLLWSQQRVTTRKGRSFGFVMLTMIALILALYPTFRLSEQLLKVLVILTLFLLFYYNFKKYEIYKWKYLFLTGVAFVASAFSIVMPFILIEREHMKPAAIAFFDLTVTTPIKAPYLFEWPWLMYYKEPRDLVPVISTAVPQNNILIIADESFRADHLSVNGYGRPTTPFLDQLAAQGWVYNWGVASSAATHSYASDAVLMTGINQLPDTSYQTRLRPTLFHYAKAMGYTTHYMSGQISRYPEEMDATDMAVVDHWVKASDLGRDTQTDFRMAEELFNILNNSSGHFIFIQKRGIHWPYSDNFPMDEAVWKEDAYDTNNSEELHQLMVDMYDNSLLYNSENFFSRLIQSDAILDNTIIIYTSDHGQTLLEDEEGSGSYSHGGSSRLEAMVPLLLITKQKFDFYTNYPASHFNVVPTALDLMGVPESEYRYSYSTSLLDANIDNAERRFYLYGALHGQGYNEESEVTRIEGSILPFDDE